jgi:2-hydroxy-3-oxopropionate reductase
MISESPAGPGAPTVGLIGLGVMGRPMATRLHAAMPMATWVHSRQPRAGRELVLAGAHWAATPRELAEHCDVVIVMVPDLPEIEDVLSGPGGLLADAGPTVVVVCSTVSPDGLRMVAGRVARDTDGRVHVIDAPVSGGEEGAIAGTLSIMVGGAGPDVVRAWPALQAMGRPAHLGPTGAGQVAKACNQMIVAATLLALGESVVVARRSGLDIDALLELLGGGLAGSRVLETKRRRLVERDYRRSGPARFMVKDLGFAIDEAEAKGVTTAQLRLSQELFRDLVDRGYGDQDTSVVQAYVESRSLPEQPP